MLTRLTVRNFKSLRNLTLDLGQINVLVGPNMSGKSNIIDLFKFVFQMLFPATGTYALSNALNVRGGLAEILWKGGDDNVLSIEMEGQDKEGHRYIYDIAISGDKRGYHRVEREQVRLISGGREFQLVQRDASGQPVLKNRDGRTLSSINAYDRSIMEFEVPDWEGNAVRRFIGSWRFYNLLPPRMKEPGPTASSLVLTEAGENFSSWLLNLQTQYPQEFDRIVRAAKDIFPEIEALFTRLSQQPTVHVVTREKHLLRPISVWQMSDGEIAFIALLSLIFSPPELTGDLNFVEEPERYLHPRLVEQLMSFIRQAQAEFPEGEAAQIVMTTHSPQLVDQVSVDELIVLERREGETKAIRPRDKVHLRELVENQTVGLGDLVYSGALSVG